MEVLSVIRRHKLYGFAEFSLEKHRQGKQVMKKYDADLVNTIINSLIGYKTERLADLLTKVGIPSTVDGNRVITQCFHCQENNVHIIVDGRTKELTWNCRTCKTRHGKHGGMIGLYRVLVDENISPNDAGKILLDNLYLELGPTNINFPVKSIYYGKPLNQLPPSVIIWAIYGSNAIEDLDREDLKSYLQQQTLI